MPLPILGRVGNRISHALHQLVFSFPSPNSTEQAFSEAHETSSGTAGKSDHATAAQMMNSIVDEPGETRALAGGIGPLSFAGSGYGVTLVLMAILLNRIHHIVRRPRLPPQPLPHPPVRSLYHRLTTKISRALTSPSAPKYLRIPGIFCLVRAWILFSILLLQVANLWPVDSTVLHSVAVGRLLAKLGQWAGSMSMEKVCWQVFLSVCVGLVCSGFANGLDRTRRRDTGASFNLFGYSFLLHLYSSPLTHHRPNHMSTYGRPDVHALFQLWLSLTELTWLQAIELTPGGRRNQLVPTAVCGGLGLGHFVFALWTSPLKFPSFTFLTHLMALFLSIIIISSVIVKAITHLFTLGYLPSPIFANLLPHEGVMPSLEDDFGIVLLKLGTACLEASQFSGLRNELIAVQERQGPWVELSTARSDVVKPLRNSDGGFGTEINDIAVAQIEDPAMESRYWRASRAFWKVLGSRLIVFACATLMSTPVGRKLYDWSVIAWDSRWWYGPRQWQFWRRQAWREPARFSRRRALRILQAYNDRNRQLRAAARAAEDAASSTAVTTALEGALDDETPPPLPWRQYLMGQEIIEDDDEDDWQDDASSTSSSSEAMTEAGLEVDMLRDLVSPPDEDQSEDTQAVLLAHLTNSSTPLTRRRFAAIMASPTRSPTPSRLNDIIADRRHATVARNDDDNDGWDDDRRRSCVVCTMEPRNTILWPCRCLALCNDCRESLAARLPARDHLCP
ncbi:hypothetical protein BD324DRAFT_645064 [Kockovaella imperatae]|uniref:RING-type domain-containing protein n=1 Tax=Kockovaella imperatae TaxID=4999 RepID=A0A1Y1UK68_9TREE|nr:hypothetical protein BD324DRAFT_645064 [Kockovaella imperatae]ORX38441.1 hypothetical protein BD324DRAFT_645064 [Kockovaella imperatae]